ncbi:hypothetical protein KR084_001161, partial [Drosophila pseudotakahashii]
PMAQANPFAKSSATTRSPTQRAQHNVEQQPEQTETITSLEDVIAKIGLAVNGLSLLFKDHRVVKQPMRDLLTELVELHKTAVASIKQEEAIEKEGRESATQTTPIAEQRDIKPWGKERIIATPKRAREPAAGQKCTPPTKRIHREWLQEKRQEDFHQVADRIFNGKSTRQLRARPDAIVVARVGEITYAELLKAVKGDSTLKHVSGDVQTIRKTAKGDLLLQLKKSLDHSAEEVKKAVGNALGGRAVVRALTEQTRLEVMDLDEVT